MWQVGGHSRVEQSERRCSDNEKFHSISPLTPGRKSVVGRPRSHRDASSVTSRQQDRRSKNRRGRITISGGCCSGATSRQVRRSDLDHAKIHARNEDDNEDDLATTGLRLPGRHLQLQRRLARLLRIALALLRGFNNPRLSLLRTPQEVAQGANVKKLATGGVAWDHVNKDQQARRVLMIKNRFFAR
jgi:hypothetical protein